MLMRIVAGNCLFCVLLHHHCISVKRQVVLFFSRQLATCRGAPRTHSPPYTQSWHLEHTSCNGAINGKCSQVKSRLLSQKYTQLRVQFKKRSMKSKCSLEKILLFTHVCCLLLITCICDMDCVVRLFLQQICCVYCLQFFISCYFSVIISHSAALPFHICF